MYTVPQYLDLLWTKFGIQSDYALADLMDWGKSRISNYRSGTLFDNTACAQVAKVLGMEPLLVIADMEMLRAQDDAKKLFWEQVAASAKKIAVWTFLSVMITLTSGIKSESYAGNLKKTTYTLYEVIRRLLIRLADSLRAFFPSKSASGMDANNNKGSHHDDTLRAAPARLSRLQSVHRRITQRRRAALSPAPAQRTPLGTGRASGPADTGCVPLSRRLCMRDGSIQDYVRWCAHHTDWSMVFRRDRNDGISTRAVARSPERAGGRKSNAATALAAALVIGLLAGASGPAQADDGAGLNLGCCSMHSAPRFNPQTRANEQWNQHNPGITYETGFTAGYFAGALIDSNEHTQAHAGILRRWQVLDGIYIGGGAGIMSRKTHEFVAAPGFKRCSYDDSCQLVERRVTLPLIAPSIATGSDRFAAELVIVPRIKDYTRATAAYLSVRIGF